MNAVYVTYHFMRADFLERIRRNSFLIVLVVTVGAAYVFVPTADANYITFMRGYHRGVYNSAWIGMLFGVVASIMLPLFGFYLVKDALDRDRQTRVGQIIASTPASKARYLMGKWLSNLAVLSSILAVMTVMAAVMQLIRAEDLSLDLLALAAPIWFMGFPALALVSAVAVLFESVSFLRGGAGNLVYFFLWYLLTMSVWLPIFIGSVTPYNDIQGVTRPMDDISRSILAHDPEADIGTGGFLAPKELFGEQLLEQEIVLFVWEGMDWTPEIILGRLFWLGFSAVIALAAVFSFDRFDPARARRSSPGCLFGLGRRLGSLVSDPFKRAGRKTGRDLDAVGARNFTFAQLTPLSDRGSHWRFGSVFLAELRLMLKGRSCWWTAGMLGFFIAGFFVPLEYVHAYLLPFAWLWPILVWSGMGAREARHFTGQLVFSAERPLRRQLPAAWLGGVFLSVLAGGGVGLQLLVAGEGGLFLTWLVGALFIPSLAMALGVWSGTSRLFELVYLLWWYLAFNGITALDFMGITEQAQTNGNPMIYLGLTATLLAAAILGRWRRLQ